ncbi:fimbrial protein [Cupriavidus sp. CuC1]|uniref:fimbrial protein n=1 Tax=Cupriavidus sp. CuC1 TaxID=3373131 RepID=UPI0037D8B16E
MTTGDIHLPNFSFQFLPPNRGELSATYRPANPSTIKVVNPVFFEGCMPLDKVRNVPMGKELARGIQAGTASKKDFSFEIRCEGKPNKLPPVKVYFQGDSPAAGMLRLSDAGKPGVASGVGIALTNNRGVKLPFSGASTIALDWRRSETGGEVYGFSGIASYAPIGGEVKPGRANATMTYVLDYN